MTGPCQVGYIAYRCGIGFEANPFPYLSDDYEDWLTGWLNARNPLFECNRDITSPLGGLDDGTLRPRH